MPREPRVPLNIKIGTKGRAFLEEVAKETGTTVSVVARACLVLGVRHKEQLLKSIRDAKEPM